MSSTDAPSRPASLAIAADPETRPAADDSVTYRVEKTPFGPIAHVQLNRPDKHNGLTLPLLAGLTRAARQAAKDRTLRAVIISGAGKSFSAGLDFASLQGKEKSIYRNFIPNLVKAPTVFRTPHGSGDGFPSPSSRWCMAIATAAGCRLRWEPTFGSPRLTQTFPSWRPSGD